MDVGYARCPEPRHQFTWPPGSAAAPRTHLSGRVRLRPEWKVCSPTGRRMWSPAHRGRTGVGADR